MTKIISAVLLTLALALILSIYGVAQQPASSPKTMSMDQMMEQCRQHCESTMKSLDSLKKTIADAKRSNDPVKMRAALDAVEKPLAEMGDHMNMCMSMMKMMGNMHMGGQSDQNRPPAK